VKSLRVGLWGSGVEMKNVEILGSMQRAIAQEAEALREKPARLIKAQAELEADGQLRRACEIITQNRAGRQRRRMQMITSRAGDQHDDHLASNSLPWRAASESRQAAKRLKASAQRRGRSDCRGGGARHEDDSGSDGISRVDALGPHNCASACAPVR
jgi:hypothetical protein